MVMSFKTYAKKFQTTEAYKVGFLEGREKGNTCEKHNRQMKYCQTCLDVHDSYESGKGLE